MKPKTLILMGVAIACGLIASYMTSKLISEQKEMVWVARAKKTMPQWYPVKNPLDDFVAEEIEKKDLPKNAVDGNLFRRDLPPEVMPRVTEELSKLKNRALLRTLNEKDILTVDMLQ